MSSEANACQIRKILYDYSHMQRSNEFLGIPLLEDVSKKKEEEESRENLD